MYWGSEALLAPCPVCNLVSEGKGFQLQLCLAAFFSPPHLLPLSCTITRHGLVLSQKDWIYKHIQTNLMPPLFCRADLHLLSFNHVCSSLLNHLAELELQFHVSRIVFKLGLLLLFTQAAYVGWQCLKACCFAFIIDQKQFENNSLEVEEDHRITES